MNDETLKMILKYIENYLREEPYPIYVDLAKNIEKIYGVTMNVQRVSDICKEISERLDIPLNVGSGPRTRISKERQKMADAADKYGISDKEVFVLHSNGYAFSTLAMIYYKCTGKSISQDYFKKKFTQYCEKEGLNSKQIKGYRRPNSDKAAEAIKPEERSEFFKRALVETNLVSFSERRKLAVMANDPYKHLHDDPNER